MEEEARYSHFIFKQIQFLMCRRYVLTWTYMIAIALCLNQERNMIDAVSTKTIYYVSRNKVDSHVIASRNCYVQGGNLIDLESSLTKVFLRKFWKVIEPNVDTLYFTGLRYSNTNFMWIKNPCSFAENVAAYIKDFTPDPNVQAFLICYVGGSSGNLGEKFVGLWQNPSDGQHSLICQVSTTQECSFVERRKAVAVDLRLQLQMYVGVDLNTCQQHCSDMEECGAFQHHRYSRDCTLWGVDKLDNQSNLTVDTTISNLTVRYKDCVEIQRFDALDIRQGNSYLPCNFDIETNIATVDRLASDTSTLGSYFSTWGTTIEEVGQTASTIHVDGDITTESSTRFPVNTTYSNSNKLRTTIVQTASAIRVDTNYSGLVRLGMKNKKVVSTSTTLAVDGGITKEGSTQFPFNTNYYNISPWGSEVSTVSSGYIETSYTWSTTLRTESSNAISQTRRPIMFTSASSVKPLDVALAMKAACLCTSKPGKSHTFEQKAEFTRGILSHLSIDINNTSANIRKFICAKDDRPSAKSIGSFGGVIIGGVLSVPFLFDIINLTVFLSRFIKKTKGSATAKLNTICPE